MNEMIEIVTEKNGEPITTSLKVAEKFNKRHDHVMRDIDNLISDSPKLGNEMFVETTYKNRRGKKYRCFNMNRDGFSLLAMGFTGREALYWKLEYIQAFNKMESFIKSIQNAKLDYPALTKAIEQSHEEPKFYHFSNEINMINRIVLGTDARHFKEENKIDKKENSIRPYLTIEQIKAIEELQRIDVGLLVANMEFEKRKEILQAHFNKKAIGV